VSRVRSRASAGLTPGRSLQARHVEVLDVAGQFADAARRELVGEAVAEADALKPGQLALAIATDYAGFGDWSSCVQSERSRWIAWVRSRTKRRRCSSSIDSARTSSGSSAGPQLVALAAHDVGDRQRVTGVGLGGPLTTTGRSRRRSCAAASSCRSPHPAPPGSCAGSASAPKTGPPARPRPARESAAASGRPSLADAGGLGRRHHRPPLLPNPAHQQLPTLRTGPRVCVKLHPVPSLGLVPWTAPSLQGGPDDYRRTFLGITASPRRSRPGGSSQRLP
jgi:hypothetical protein